MEEYLEDERKITRYMESPGRLLKVQHKMLKKELDQASIALECAEKGAVEQHILSISVSKNSYVRLQNGRPSSHLTRICRQKDQLVRN